MRLKLLLRSVLLITPMALFTGCVGFNTALFMTKSNAGLDLDMKPPTAEINISRKEGVVEPSFEGGKTPPVMASFSSKIGTGGGLGRFFFGVDQTFSGGDAAVTMSKLYDSTNVFSDVGNEGNTNAVRFDSGLLLDAVPKANKKTGGGWFGLKKKLFGLPEPGEVRPFFFGTDTQLGVKVAWNGVGGPYPDTVKIGFNRKEMAIAPVTFTPLEIRKNENGLTEKRTNVVRIPSFLATVDSNVEGGRDVEVGWLQYFATGESASSLARQFGVRKAMLERADPKAAAASEQEKQARAEIDQLRIENPILVSEITNEVDRIKGLTKLDAAVETLKESGLLDESNTAEVRKFDAAKKEKTLKGIAVNLTGPGDIPKVRKYLELLKTIK